MNKTLRVLATALVLVMAAGCNRQGPELPQAIQQDPDGQDAGRDGVDTVTIDPNAAFIGSAVDTTGQILTRQREFESGQTVFVSVPSKGHRVGSELEVFWFHSDGISRKSERKRITGQFTVFQFEPTEPANYNAEVDVNGRPVGLVEFVVK